MDPGLAKVTLTQLLSHTSGVPSDNQAFTDALARSQTQEGNLDELRYWLVREWCPQKLATDPGTTFAYANMNYVLVGAMIERVTGRTWDELIIERVFTPLGLRTGRPRQSGVDWDGSTPRSVTIRRSGTPKAMLSGPNGDNPPVIGPAGIAHMSVLDFARWAAWNAGEGARPPALVQPETLRKLHTMVIAMAPQGEAKPGTPPGGQYGLGMGRGRGRVGAAAAALPRRLERPERRPHLGRPRARHRHGADDQHRRREGRRGAARRRRRALPPVPGARRHAAADAGGRGHAGGRGSRRESDAASSPAIPAAARGSDAGVGSVTRILTTRYGPVSTP